MVTYYTNATLAYELWSNHEGALDVINGKLEKSKKLADAPEVKKRSKKHQLYRKANSYAKSMITIQVIPLKQQVRSFDSLGKRNIRAKALLGGQTEEMELTDILCVLDINRNLFSVLVAQDRNPNTELSSISTKYWLKVNNNIKLYCSRNIGDTLYKAALEPITNKLWMPTVVPGCSHITVSRQKLYL
ncbi:hypothetical protein CDAR_241401 [Caerostris darwini]|uniref:Uncharacterized protein n=1 Tax=Caerostris darwini TaxID=1538125 RepID=A0AAV4TF59_9ARAC|nr:hypothetical protein CDAR_241401 [Caerostris darwini]